MSEVIIGIIDQNAKSIADQAIEAQRREIEQQIREAKQELEKARDRMVNLISLYLLDTTDGDLTKAAISLRDHSFLSRSKGGSDMLKRLIAMPESSNFGMAGYADAQTPLLALWSLRSYTDYQAELARRSQIAHAIRAAQWLAEQFELDTDELEAAGADAEAVQWLAVAPGTPLLEVERVSYTYEDQPVEVRRGQYVTERFHYFNGLSGAI